MNEQQEELDFELLWNDYGDSDEIGRVRNLEGTNKTINQLLHYVKRLEKEHTTLQGECEKQTETLATNKEVSSYITKFLRNRINNIPKKYKTQIQTAVTKQFNKIIGEMHRDLFSSLAIMIHSHQYKTGSFEHQEPDKK